MTPRMPVSGIMWVNSDVIKPTHLSRQDFDAWYCEEHIHSVVAKSGVRSAHRYDHIIDGLSTARRLRFLTIYEMPDIGFMETEEFRGLEGQSPGPNREKIFENAEFDTRSYELVQVDESESSKNTGPAPILLCTAISHSSDLELDDWYRKEHVPLISRIKGYRRTSRYKLATNSVLSGFERSFPVAPKWLAIHEFEGPEIPWEELATIDETSWAKKVIPGILNVDFGCFRLKRAYKKQEKAKL